ncbi:Acyl-coenzyme A:6-aminopenicillanic acid acyl-transferase [Tangfeifania diversioriginum]|uniref:Acyl-coenzyme A:6-aminopenicillanic acid acyl-transferase n=1 Tax=Tangfeifania diversioriginum TaxID=1168035 RepID=A0A1M6MNH0_9BACT|nr:C45 family peptidase [Tangfeifania diversioriginum]SHJ85055.1 Acyl-coenzyme A:6-aminopenicillanic acid acyl-transferase [Tangfeifania diversioriginum]
MKLKILTLKVLTTFRVSLLFCTLTFILLSGCSTYKAFNTVFNENWDNEFPNKGGTPRLKYYEGIPVIHLYGGPQEMGRQYGSILQKQLNALAYISEKFFPEKTLNSYFEKATKLKEQLPPETVAFITGMAENSGVEYLKLLALNTVPKATCSVLAVWGDATNDGQLLMGRNADYNFKKINKALGLTVVKHPHHGYATVASSFLGLAGTFTGINEKGVCYGNMLVYNGFEDEDKFDGLPVQLAMQYAAEKAGSADEMIKILTEQQHLVPVNVMCADSTEALLAELGQQNFAIRKGSKGVLAASNYFYSPGMFEETVTDKRFSQLMLEARDNYGTFNFGNLKKAMHAARKPRENLQCILFEPAKMQIHVSMNRVPATKGPFIPLDVKKLLSE